MEVVEKIHYNKIPRATAFLEATWARRGKLLTQSDPDLVRVNPANARVIID